MSSVSVVVPTRNRSRLLATTLRSVLWQREIDLEVLVVDDASVDDTQAVVAGFADPRLSIVRQPVSQGPSAARNRGASRASGDWIAFVDDDDVWAPHKLRRQIGAAAKARRDWVYVGAVNIGADFGVVSGNPPPAPAAVAAALPAYNPIPGGGSNVILRRGLLEEVGGFDERFPPCEDWEMWVRLIRCGPPASVSAPLLGYRLHSGSNSLDTDRIRRSARLIEQVHAAAVDWGRMHRWLAESSLRTERHGRAVGHYVQAAVRGQAGGVVSDLSNIARRRTSALTGSPGVQAPSSEQGWIDEASTWLRELQSSAPSGSRGMGLK